MASTSCKYKLLLQIISTYLKYKLQVKGFAYPESYGLFLSENRVIEEM